MTPIDIRQLALQPKPSERVKAWLEKHARFAAEGDKLFITYTGQADLVPPDVQRWVDSWRGHPEQRSSNG